MTGTRTGGGSRHPAKLDDGAIHKLELDGKILGNKLAREFGTVKARAVVANANVISFHASPRTNV